MVSRNDIFTIRTPLQLGGGRGDKMGNIAYLVIIMADSTSETWCQLTNDAHGHHTVLNRTEIHAVLAEISKMRCLGSGRFGVHMPLSVVENSVVSEERGQIECSKAD